jgi:hypothetical protein
MRHQLLGNLYGEFGIQPASHIDRDQFLALIVCLQFGLSVSACECTEPAPPRGHHATVSRMRGCDTEHCTGGRKDSVVPPNTAARSQPTRQVRCWIDKALWPPSVSYSETVIASLTPG